MPEDALANIVKPCALQEGLEVPVDDVQGVHCRADGVEHETIIPLIRATSAWSEPSSRLVSLSACGR